jgi:sigma-B regulation protein RsbU (phosphoserine phosphatase)
MCRNEQKLILLEKKLNAILNGIPDVIKVYNTDYTTAFFNKAGYDFYRKSPKEIKGKKCYEILNRHEKCIDCPFEKIIKTRQIIKRERYIPELNKFIDTCYSPIIDEDGEIQFIVERLRDITEKKIINKMLSDGKVKYKKIINNLSDAVVIIVDNTIVLANYEACKITGLEYDDFIGSNVYKYFDEKYIKALHKIFRNIIAQKVEKNIHDYDFVSPNGKLINVQIAYSYIVYEGNPAIMAIIRDITEMKQELKRAADFQRKIIQREVPSQEFANIVNVYMPAKDIGGDFYRIHKVSENLIIGIVMDVRGKGITAALNISAIEVLYFQEISNTHEPMEIIYNINKKLVEYYEENYIAMCCFSMDFNKNELKVVGAGINQFIFQKKGSGVEERIVRGPFLGMFKDSEFDEEIIHFNSGDKVFFFTDGLDFILDEDKIVQRYMGKVNIEKFKEYIDDFLNDTILETGQLDDDCLMIAIEVK